MFLCRLVERNSLSDCNRIATSGTTSYPHRARSGHGIASISIGWRCGGLAEVLRTQIANDGPGTGERQRRPLWGNAIFLELGGRTTYILANPGYREVVTKVGDDVFLLDATQGEQRAREDEEQIAKLFPGKHKLTVVVTDLAWPHVSGLRYWVASGAAVLAHKTAYNFLQSVIDRKWTLAPDFLEQHRETIKFKFTGVDCRYELTDTLPGSWRIWRFCREIISKVSIVPSIIRTLPGRTSRR